VLWRRPDIVTTYDRCSTCSYTPRALGRKDLCLDTTIRRPPKACRPRHRGARAQLVYLSATTPTCQPDERLAAMIAPTSRPNGRYHSTRPVCTLVSALKAMSPSYYLEGRLLQAFSLLTANGQHRP